jgi:hypothetical protein
VVVTLDRGFEYQHTLASLPVSVLIVIAADNRMETLEPLVPAILTGLERVDARTLLLVP